MDATSAPARALPPALSRSVASEGLCALRHALVGWSWRRSKKRAGHAAFALLSGPAAGVVGAARIAELAGFRNALAFDMGGTSTDVCAIVDGRARASTSAGRRDPGAAAHGRGPHRRRGRGARSCGGRRWGPAGRAGERGGASGSRVLRASAAERPTVTDANLTRSGRPLLGEAARGRRALDAGGAAARVLGGLDPRRPASRS